MELTLLQCFLYFRTILCGTCDSSTLVLAAAIPQKKFQHFLRITFKLRRDTHLIPFPSLSHPFSSDHFPRSSISWFLTRDFFSRTRVLSAQAFQHPFRTAAIAAFATRRFPKLRTGLACSCNNPASCIESDRFINRRTPPRAAFCSSNDCSDIGDRTF